MSRLLRFTTVAIALVILSGTGCKKNTAPDPPEIQGPSVAKPGAVLTYGFTSADPDGDDVWYMVSWGDDTPMAWSPGHPSGEREVLTHSYPDAGAYFIKAKAKDNDGAESGWSDSVQVAVGYLPPNPPLRPSGTVACTTGAAYTYTAKATHPLGDSVAIQFFWGDTIGDWGPMVPSGESYETTHAFETLGVYKIAARARDARGLESAWSDSLTVTVDTVHANPGGAPQNVTLAAATDSTVSISWTPPSSMTPNKYLVSFKRTGYAIFDSIGAVTGTNLVHYPAGMTGQYKVTAIYDSVQYSAGETPSTTPIWTTTRRIPELSDDSIAGYGWDRTTGQATLHNMASSDSAAKVDFYVTDFAPGFAGPDYFVASPDTAPLDPGGTVPAGYWLETRFTHLDSLATEDSMLPHYAVSRYRKSSILDSLPRLVACYTQDGYYALVKTTAVDTINGTSDIQTWFQLVRDLRLIEH